MHIAGLSKNIEQSLGQLNPYQQKKLLEFIDSLIEKPKKGNQNLLRFAGSIDKADLELMERAISEGCEKIDHNEW
jgi:hypothetical protein